MGSSAHADLEPELPRRIGRYDAFLQIGAGGMARVYLGVQHGPFATKRLVVLKQLREEIANDPQFLEMFIDEARIALRLNHPNVVHTYEVLDETPDYYLVMEYLEGQSLLEILRRVGRPKVPLQEHIWILTQLLAGLHYAHELRDFNGHPLEIVHRDVSPANVFVCKTGGVKLLDFGIAKLSGAVAATRNGILKGKLGYVAPEQCLGHAASVQSDIYAVGVMLWEAMARRRRYSGENEAAQIQARIQGAEPPVEKVWPQAPAALAAIARRALSTQPEARYASAREFQRDLERYLVHKQSRAGAESVSRLVRAHFEKDRAAVYGAIATKLEESTPAAQTDEAPSPSAAAVPPPLANDNAGSAASSLNAEANTSLVTIDAVLLQATRPNSAIAVASREFMAELRRTGAQLATSIVRGLMRGLLSLRSRRRGALTMVVALATAAVVSALADTRHQVAEPARGEARAPARVVQVITTAPVMPRIDVPLAGSPVVDAKPAVDLATSSSADALEPPVELMSAALPVVPKDGATRERKSHAAPEARRFERRRPRADDDLDSLLTAIRYKTSDRRTWSQVVPGARTRTGFRPAAESRAVVPHIEPGMDLRVNSAERTAGCIDEEDPY